ncbi:uncharacterized protein LOC127852179 [Dreissena polymorpha]|uniref:uncharacterized protein LOC127852179 n=1 Tax=Dreissena polymorpha TaxID=45954 RepID=UPI002264A475|nr:uncharacterized protein LOC127852179 [Dreissena polymorpha]
MKCFVTDILRMNHKCPYSLCCTCLRNSHVNPIVCHTCGKEIEPFIGDGVGAILVAGYDECNTFVEDIRQFAMIATSRVVPSMCIRESNLKTIIPNEKDSLIEIKTRILKVLEELVMGSGIHTLLFYYSGHNERDKHTQNNCLQITKNCSFDLCLLSDNLRQLMKGNAEVKIKKTIVFLDCCYPELVDMPTDKVIQINACAQNTEADAIKGDASFFTKCVIQALTMKTMTATEYKCSLSECDSRCLIHEDYISVERLVKFISHHADNTKSKIPIISQLKNVTPNDVYLAYNYHFPVQFDFEIEMKQFGDTSQSESVFHVKVGLPDCLELGRLKTRLWEEYLGRLAKITITPNARALVNPDMFCIECKSGPSKQDVQEIEHINDLPRKQFLKFKLRDMQRININKPVAMLLKNVTLIPEQYRKTIIDLDETAAKMETDKKEPVSNLAKPSIILEEDTHNVDAFFEKHGNYYERCLNEWLSIIKKHMKENSKLLKGHLEIKCETLGDDGAGFVTFAIVEEI